MEDAAIVFEIVERLTEESSGPELLALVVAKWSVDERKEFLFCLRDKFCFACGRDYRGQVCHCENDE